MQARRSEGSENDIVARLGGKDEIAASGTMQDLSQPIGGTPGAFTAVAGSYARRQPQLGARFTF